MLWSLFMGAGLLTGGLVLYTLGSRTLPAAELALLSGIEVMLAPFWVWLFLGETADSNTLVGGAFILAAVLWNGLSRARGRGLVPMPRTADLVPAGVPAPALPGAGPADRHAPGDVRTL
jgi:hypothetical protein